MGSVKDLTVLAPGRGRFVFSDRYSVFDWGEMPDEIPHKGEAIAILGAYFFERLHAMKVPTHYCGLVEDGRPKRLADVAQPSNVIEVKLLNVIKPAFDGTRYDYSMYTGTERDILIPLEVIYRNSLPAGSSVFKRLKEGQTTIAELGLSNPPKPDQKLDPAIYDVSTKLEVTDRYVSWTEAQKIAALSDAELHGIRDLTARINALITEEFARIGLVNEDGKIEYGFDDERRIMPVDVFGTLDECRFTYRGMPVSKEIARIHYRETPWHRAVEEAKAKDRGNWKHICALKPDRLPPQLKKLISQVYCAVTNEVTKRAWFDDVPPLAEIMETGVRSSNLNFL